MNPEVAFCGLHLTFPLSLALMFYYPTHWALVPWGGVYFPLLSPLLFHQHMGQCQAEGLIHFSTLELPGHTPSQLNLILGAWDPSINVF